MNKKIISILLVSILVATQAGIALANGKNPPDSHGQRVRAQATMVVLCDKLSSSVLKKAQELGLCLPGKGWITSDAIARGEITPEFASQVGNCGTSWINITPTGGGWAYVDYGLISSRGNIANVSWSVNVVNWSLSTTDNYTGSAWPYTANWSNRTTDNFGAGLIGASLSGTATIWWGLVCGIVTPVDTRYIG